MPRRLIYCACLVLFSTTYSLAQVPQITGVSTYSAPVNGNITITGSNFSSILAENKVFFGTVKAEVESATSTSLTVVIPSGIDYGVINVIVNGLTASSPGAFTTSFSGSGAIDPTSFGVPEPLPASMNTFLERLLADIDGDGKLDIVGRKEGTRGFVVARNTSDFASGSISFAEPVFFTMDSYPRDIEVADMDGDGKPEVLILKNISTATGNFVTLFKNTAVTGAIDASSFDTGTDFATVSDPQFFEVVDLDLDGKRDVIVSNETSILAVHQNNSAQGVINVSSLAPRVQYTCSVSVRAMKAGDLDGDARPEIVYSGSSGNKAFRILRNNSTTGVLITTSFTTDAAVGTTLESGVMLADLNRDGKPDVITNQNLYPNASTSGVFTFSAPVDMLPGYGGIGSIINDYDGDGSPDAVHIGNNNGIYAIRVPGTENMVFQQSVNLNLGLVGVQIASADLNGDGKPDLLLRAINATSASNTYVVKNNNLPLPSPSITSIEPASAATGSVIAITGANFGHFFANNVVTLNGQELTVLSGTSTSLEVLIPANASSGYISVRANDLLEVTSTQFLTVIDQPVIDSFTPKVAAAGTNIILTGENFGVSPDENTVFFGAVKAEIVAASANNLQVTVPFGATYGPISLSVNGLITKSTDPFTLSFPEGKPLDMHTFHQFSLYANTNAWPLNALKLSDIDSDGKTDIIICNTVENEIVIYRNISSPGQLSRHSFAEPVKLHSPLNGPDNLQIGDLDGDGKPDLAVRTLNSISVYRNISEPGDIDVNSFEEPFDFIIASFLNDFFLEDMDSDGKLDIIWNRLDFSVEDTHDQSSFPFFIARNISRPGIMNAGTFEPEKRFLISIATFGNFVITDVNKDHRPDIIGMTSNSSTFYSKNVFIYENNSTPANLAFGTYYSTQMEWQTSHVTAGDLNNDGIIDLVGTDNTFQKTYILSSAAPITSIPNSPYTRASLTLNSIGATISDMDGDGKPDLILNNEDVKILKNVSTEVLNANAFIASVSIPARQQALYVGDLDGDGLNDLVGLTPDSVLITHNINKATSIINTFTPQAGEVGTNVVLTGANFSATPAGNIVRVNGSQAQVMTATETTLTITIPPGATTGNISVEVDGMMGTSEEVFSVLLPQTIAFDPIPAQRFGTDFFVSLPEKTSAGLPITFTSSDNSIAYIWYDQVRIAGAGTVTITASHPGNTSYAAAAPVKQVLQIAKGVLEIQFIDDVLDQPVYEDVAPFHVHTLALGYIGDYSYYEVLPVHVTSNTPQISTVADTLVTVHKPGSAFLTFAHSGNKNYEPYSITRELIVKAHSQSIIFEPIVVDCSEPDRTIELLARSTSGLPVTFISTNPLIASIDGTTAIVKTNGIVDIVARQEGNNYYPAAEPLTRQLIINMNMQTVTFEEIPVKDSKDKTFSIDVSSTSGLTVDVMSTNTDVASVAGEVVTIHGTGETDLTATQDGNACFFTAEPVTRKLTVMLVTSSFETGVSDDVMLFPNPAAANVRIVAGGDKTLFTNIKIVDAVGETVYEATLAGSEESINVSYLPSGVYFVKISNPGGAVFKRLVKN